MDSTFIVEEKDTNRAAHLKGRPSYLLEREGLFPRLLDQLGHLASKRLRVCALMLALLQKQIGHVRALQKDPFVTPLNWNSVSFIPCEGASETTQLTFPFMTSLKTARKLAESLGRNLATTPQSRMHSRSGFGSGATAITKVSPPMSTIMYLEAFPSCVRQLPEATLSFCTRMLPG